MASNCQKCGYESVGEDLGDHPLYLNHECDNCGMMWDSEGEVHDYGRIVCRKCGEATSERATDNKADWYSLCGNCAR